jgi:hypothetical protein
VIIPGTFLPTTVVVVTIPDNTLVIIPTASIPTNFPSTKFTPIP